MIRSLASTLFALVMMGGLAVSAQADSTPTSGTVTGNSTLTATADPFVFDSTFTGSGVDMASGNFTATNMSTTKFNSTFTSFTSSGTFIDVFAGGTVFGTFTENGTVTGASDYLNHYGRLGDHGWNRDVLGGYWRIHCHGDEHVHQHSNVHRHLYWVHYDPRTEFIGPHARRNRVAAVDAETFSPGTTGRLKAVAIRAVTPNVSSF